MRILWDERKRLLNLDKHGMDFAVLDEVFFVDAVILQGKLNRLIAIGPVEGQMTSIIFARYGLEAISTISMRPASKAERRLYEQEKAKGI